ncbi:MAG: YdcF family protein, partial [Gemmatimonadaceae bacterium]
VDSVFSTRDEAVRMRELARSLDISSVAVVTSPTHTYRACATFEKVGFAVTCVPSESRDVALGSLGDVTDRVRAFQLWLYEMAGLAKYRVRRWI